MADRDQEITKVVAQMVEWCNKFLQLSEIEKTGFLLLQSQINSLNRQQQKLMEDNRIIEEQNANARGMAEKILAVAKEEAVRVVEIANEKNFKAIKLIQEAETQLTKVKQFCSDIELRRFREIESGVSDSRKKVAAPVK